MYIDIYVYVCVYIYIYRERERERGRERVLGCKKTPGNAGHCATGRGAAPLL